MSIQRKAFPGGRLTEKIYHTSHTISQVLLWNGEHIIIKTFNSLGKKISPKHHNYKQNSATRDSTNHLKCSLIAMEQTSLIRVLALASCWRPFLDDKFFCPPRKNRNLAFGRQSDRVCLRLAPISLAPIVRPGLIKYLIKMKLRCPPSCPWCSCPSCPCGPASPSSEENTLIWLFKFDV
jgi:hypothetical protein